MRRSLVVAAAASGIAAVVGAFGALAIERGRWPGQKLLAAVTVIPIALPELVQGIAALLWFSALSMSLGLISMTLAHATFAMSYVVVTVRARLRDHDPALEEAAADLGAAPLQVFLQVTLPLMLPGVVAGAMLAFALSFDDFLISFFTTGAGTDTLPIRLYALIRFGLNKEVYALSTLLIAVTAVGLLAHHMMLRPRR
jgi:spermidine/putrescine transport system permease protein